MTQFMQQIDTDTAWFLIAVLVILLLSALAGWGGARMELKDLRKRIATEEARRAQWIKAVYADIDIPAYRREAKHPLDARPYGLLDGQAAQDAQTSIVTRR